MGEANLLFEVKERKRIGDKITKKGSSNCVLELSIICWRSNYSLGDMLVIIIAGFTS